VATASSALEAVRSLRIERSPLVDARRSRVNSSLPERE
jgi:hypothetical protein